MRKGAAAIIDAPLLYERFDAECDAVVAVVADRELRIARILARDAITRRQAELRLSRQHDDEFFARTQISSSKTITANTIRTAEHSSAGCVRFSARSAYRRRKDEPR